MSGSVDLLISRKGISPPDMETGRAPPAEFLPDMAQDRTQNPLDFQGFSPTLLPVARKPMKRLLMTLVAFLAAISLSCVSDESDHRIDLPDSAEQIQNRGDSRRSVLDRGIATILVIDREDLEGFIAKLNVDERRKPVQANGDPTVNGWNVWPNDAKTFVPGNKVYSGFKKTWDAEVVPVEMLSCQSPAGDWLHVEVWSLSDAKVLLKLFTDWN